MNNSIHSLVTKVLHLDPLVLSVDKFFTDEECDAYLALRDHPDAAHKLEQSATFSAVLAQPEPIFLSVLSLPGRKFPQSSIGIS